MVKPLDPNTATLAEVAQASRSLRQAKWTGIIVGLAVAAVAWTPLTSTDWLHEALVPLALVIAGVGAYRLTYEVLVKLLPPN